MRVRIVSCFPFHLYGNCEHALVNYIAAPGITINDVAREGLRGGASTRKIHKNN